MNPGEILMNDFSEHQEKIAFLEQELSDIYELISNQTYSPSEFIGAHPITLTFDSLTKIANQKSDFLVCEKTDGVRFLLIILSNGQAYFTGRQTGSNKRVIK